MEYISKSIYSRPEIRRTLLPLWSAWVLTAFGAVCGVLMIMLKEMSQSITSLLLGCAFVGGCALLTVLCYWTFGDSRRPYNKELRVTLEPTHTYYSSSMEKQIVSALESGDEAALQAIKRHTQPQLVLVRYSDSDERIYYSQLTRVEGGRYIPLTNIIVNKVK